MSLTPYNRPAFPARPQAKPNGPKMTKAQESLYWRLWGRAACANGWRGEEANTQRHAAHVKALGRDKSHKDMTNREIDLVFAEFRLLADPANLNAAMEAANPEIGERRRLVAGTLERIESEAYLRPVLETEHQYAAFLESRGWQAWRDLPIGLLRSLHMTVVHRARAHGGVIPVAGPPSPIEPF
jgi:hypothetical protein